MNADEITYTGYMMSTTLHKIREQAIEHAITFYYQNSVLPSAPEIDLKHLAENGSVTNYSDGRMDFEIGQDLLVSFGTMEYSVDFEFGGVIMLCRQDVEEHWKNAL